MQDMIPVFTELLHALDMQVVLENHVEEGNFSKVGYQFFTRLWDIVCNYFPILRAFIGFVHLFRIYFSKYVMYCAGIPSPIWVFADFRQFVWAFVHTRDEPWCWGKIIFYENCWSKKLSLFSFSHFQYVSPGVYEAIFKMSLDYHLTMWHSYFLQFRFPRPFFVISLQVWLGKTLQKLDSLLLGVCQDFKEEGYITVSPLASCFELDHHFLCQLLCIITLKWSILHKCTLLKHPT